MANAVKRNKLSSLQLLRAIAVMMVVCLHGYNILLKYNNISIPTFKLLEYGAYGVDIFFVLSGFIIFYIHSKDIGNNQKLGKFLYKRTVRIIPIYWILTVVFIVLTKFNHSLFSIFMSLFLIPEKSQPIIGVAWSLRHEMFFYLMFSLLILNKKVFLPLFYVWTIGIFFFSVVPVINIANPWLNVIFSSINLEFIFGCLIAYFHLNNKTDKSKLVIIGLILVALSMVIQVSGFSINRVITWGIPTAILILGLVGLETKKDIIIPKFLVFLGDASYSIYLVHIIVILIIDKVVNFESYSSNLAVVMLIISILTATIGGAVFHVVVEKTLMNFFRKHQTRNKVVFKRSA
jgi:exopolysaccharide production protein ExoZ